METKRWKTQEERNDRMTGKRKEVREKDEENVRERNGTKDGIECHKRRKRKRKREEDD